MILTVSKYAGLCPGTHNACSTVEKLIEANDGSTVVLTIGHLMHNRLYNESLAARGVRCITVDKLEDIIISEAGKNIFVVIRTHGIPKGEENYMRLLAQKYPQLHIIDATCPSVKRIHKIAEENTGDNTVFVLFGSIEHPEVQGIISYAKGEKYVISSLEEAQSLKFGDKIPILCSQTTQNLLEFIKIKNFLKKVCTNALFFDTICNVTEKRQKDVLELAKSSDAMIVIGGYESSNTRNLYDLCLGACPRTVWIESVDDLTVDFFDGVKKVGITAGASTPDGIILEVLKNYGKL